MKELVLKNKIRELHETGLNIKDIRIIIITWP